MYDLISILIIILMYSYATTCYNFDFVVIKHHLWLSKLLVYSWKCLLSLSLSIYSLKLVLFKLSLWYSFIKDTLLLIVLMTVMIYSVIVLNLNLTMYFTFSFQESLFSLSIFLLSWSSCYLHLKIIQQKSL